MSIQLGSVMVRKNCDQRYLTAGYWVEYLSYNKHTNRRMEKLKHENFHNL
jgi:hypothetical protein